MDILEALLFFLFVPKLFIGYAVDVIQKELRGCFSHFISAFRSKEKLKNCDLDSFICCFKQVMLLLLCDSIFKLIVQKDNGKHLVWEDRDTQDMFTNSVFKLLCLIGTTVKRKDIFQVGTEVFHVSSFQNLHGTLYIY